MKHNLFQTIFVGALVLLTASATSADVVRYRFVPMNPQGNTVPTPIGPGGAVGVRTSYRGGTPQPEGKLRRPNVIATVVHPVTKQTLLVPLTLPESTPRMEHRTDRIIYNYGSYTVTIHFIPDGSVETIYNSGFLRPLYGF